MYCAKVVLFLGFIFFAHEGCSLDVEQPPSIFPTDNSTYKIYSKDDSAVKGLEITAPLVFPENDSDYTIIHNAAILRTLQFNTSNLERSHNTSEIEDLNSNAEILPGVIIGNKTHEEKDIEKTKTKSSEPVNIHNTNNDILEVSLKHTTEDNVDFDSELLQPENDANTEDKKARSFNLGKSVYNDYNHGHRAGIPYMQGQWAAVLAGSFALLAVVCYLGLLSWRRYLEHRYGNREMLLNEEDTYLTMI